MKFYEYLKESIEDKGILKAAFMAGFPACFDGDTLVCTKEGYKRIKDIKPGELVKTFNETNHNIEFKEVEQLFEYDNEANVDILKLTFENGEKVICTSDHEFFIDGKWIKAKDL